MKHLLAEILWWTLAIGLGIVMICGAVLAMMAKGAFSVDFWRGLP